MGYEVSRIAVDAFAIPRAAESLDDVTEPQVGHPDSAHPSRISKSNGSDASVWSVPSRKPSCRPGWH